uniref:Uncharacterized protein n=1 Tax=Anopheles merus TaxID=30066 RepID=A0A182V7P7_ANOME
MAQPPSPEGRAKAFGSLITSSPPPVDGSSDREVERIGGAVGRGDAGVRAVSLLTALATVSKVLLVLLLLLLLLLLRLRLRIPWRINICALAHCPTGKWHIRLAGKKRDQYQFLGSIAHGNGELIVAELTLRLQEDKVDGEYSKTSQRLL